MSVQIGLHVIYFQIILFELTNQLLEHKWDRHLPSIEKRCSNLMNILVALNKSVTNEFKSVRMHVVKLILTILKSCFNFYSTLELINKMFNGWCVCTYFFHTFDVEFKVTQCFLTLLCVKIIRFFNQNNLVYEICCFGILWRSPRNMYWGECVLKSLQ